MKKSSMMIEELFHPVAFLRYLDFAWQFYSMNSCGLPMALL